MSFVFPGLIRCAGVVDDTGATLGGAGFTSELLSVGIFRITLDDPVSPDHAAVIVNTLDVALLDRIDFSVPEFFEVFFTNSSGDEESPPRWSFVVFNFPQGA